MCERRTDVDEVLPDMTTGVLLLALAAGIFPGLANVVGLHPSGGGRSDTMPPVAIGITVVSAFCVSIFQIYLSKLILVMLLLFGSFFFNDLFSVDEFLFLFKVMFVSVPFRVFLVLFIFQNMCGSERRMFHR